MVSVRSVVDSKGAWWVIIEVNGQRSADFGPYEEIQRDAFIEGAKSFASPHIVQFLN